jgi:hypothetical protein
MRGKPYDEMKVLWYPKPRILDMIAILIARAKGKSAYRLKY